MQPEYEHRLEKEASLAGGETFMSLGERDRQVARGSSQAGRAYYRYGP